MTDESQETPERKIPAHLTTGQIARANGIDVKTARTRCEKAGILERDTESGWHYVQAPRLQARLPAMYDRVWDAFVMGDLTEDDALPQN